MNPSIISFFSSFYPEVVPIFHIVKMAHAVLIFIFASIDWNMID